jgi:hypothetical protein
MIWITALDFRGWACSECEWNCPVPTLLTDPEAKSAYDRLSSAKFRGHDCAEHFPQMRSADPPSIRERMRRLVVRGYKPKDAIEIVLQEVRMEYRDAPKAVESAKAEAEDFLRQVREGLV